MAMVAAPSAPASSCSGSGIASSGIGGCSGSALAAPSAASTGYGIRKHAVARSLLRRPVGRGIIHSCVSRKAASKVLVSTTTVIPSGETDIIVDDVDYIEPGGDVGNGAGGSGGNEGGGGGRGGDGPWDGKGENGWSGGSEAGDSSLGGLFGLWDAFVKGWRARVRTDPQFPFKVLIEEIIGVGACVLGDMASRPNFGLNELDFVFSTIVVGSILNFTLMYMLAPTSAGADISRLPYVFASCPPGHMFEPGAYTAFDRFGTFVYKGVLFAGAGFMAGLVGTAMSTLLLKARKKIDSNFTMQNKPPPTLLNAATWAIHMGLSSNLRYQAINGLEFLLAGVMNPVPFKASVFMIRAVNNVLGGTSFVLLARFTGSQRAQATTTTEDDVKSALLKERTEMQIEKSEIPTV